MSTFLTGDALNDAIDDIIQNSKKFLHITSPYIKLDDHFRERFDILKNNPSTYLHVLFGKNEDDFYRSIKSEDLEYFKSFPNVSIVYEPRLHAKSYINDSNGIVTSMNLYDYSAENNVEYGVAFSKNKLYEKVYEEHLDNHFRLLEESAHCIFIKRPVFKKEFLGFSKNYLKSEVLLDKFDSFRPNDSTEERIVYQDIDVIELSEKDVVPVLKSRAQKREEGEARKSDTKPVNYSNSASTQNNDQKIGYCIRSGQEIPFNPSQPFFKEAYYEWLEWKNMDYGENFCHRTRKRSYTKTSMRHPILNSFYENGDVWN